MTTDGAGNWVAVWFSNENLGGTAGTDNDIFVATSSNNGGTWSAPALLNTNGTSDTGSDAIPQVTTDGAGNWAAVWLSDENLGGTASTDADIFVATFIIDFTPPVITVTSPGTTTVEAGGTWTEPGATATDNIDGAVGVTVGGDTVNPGAAVGTVFTVTYDSNDAAGNNAIQATRTVTVVDTTAPVVTVISLTTSDSRPALIGSIDDATATISVTVNGQTNPATNNGITWILADNVLTTLPAGTYDVAVTATDGSSNAGSDATTNELTIQAGSGGGTVTSNLAPAAIIDGERLELTAPAGGSDYRWKKDGVFLVDGGTISGALTQTLVIDPLALTDSGVYSCQYENGVARAVVETDGFIVTVLAVASLPITAIVLTFMLMGLALAGLVTLKTRRV